MGGMSIGRRRRIGEVTRVPYDVGMSVLIRGLGGARSFHAKYWDGDPSHDPVLKAIWKEQRAEMTGYYRGRELNGGH